MIELKALQGQVKRLVDDLRDQVSAADELRAQLEEEWRAATKAQRTGGTFETWLEDALDQAAVGWVLGCVFVRFCEDNALVEPLWIGGPEPHALASKGAAARQAYGVQNPRHNDRHWLREAFTYLRGLRPTAKIFDEHNPVWRFDISGEAAEELSAFFRRSGTLRTEDLDTRFLGDLYQDLSVHAQKTYALLQTPEFVEEFILDRTFEPAVKEFGLAPTKVIDPTCGSGHFLLGAFHRMFGMWRDREPGSDVRELTQRALDQVTGVDINPFAVAIARFRLLIAALKVCGLSSLERAPAFAVRVAAGDSLLTWGNQSGHQGDLVALAEGRPEFAYFSEDADLLKDYLAPNQYTVVVGNPPYITVKDKVLNERYRGMYSACSGKYALSVPFAQRFFELARRGDHDGQGAGWVGQITSNSFMKREFGKKLINDFFAKEVELAEVVDTSGAYIPGHGTPTVILVGLNRLISGRYGGTIRMVMGVRGEPTQPDYPANAAVWSAILAQIDTPGSESSWIGVADSGRARLNRHPWSLSGGGANSLMDAIVESRSRRLIDAVSTIGITAVTGEDDLYVLPDAATAARMGLTRTMPLVEGEAVRDFHITSASPTLWPYGEDLSVLPIDESEACGRLLNVYRTAISRRKRFGTPMVERGLSWWEWQELYREKLSAPLSIAIASVVTHNHSVVDRGGKVFKQSVVVIKLPEGATEDKHLELSGLLNSSMACFWLKQVSQAKVGTDNSSGGGNRWSPEPWYEFYDFTATKLQQFPLPVEYPLELARRTDQLARRLANLTPAACAEAGAPTRTGLKEAWVEHEVVRALMITLQEELDWQVYHLYGLLDDDLTVEDPPELKLGERAFEIVLARKMATGEVETQWFARHGSTPITEFPDHWPAEYKKLVERRIEVIESDRNIGLIERPECKRRWATEGWDAMQAAALRSWLLDRLETPEVWGSVPKMLSVAQLADRVRHDEDFRSVLDLWVGHDQHDLVKTIGKLVADEHVPYLPAQRYKSAGLRKRAQWERTWVLQRREDAGETVEIAVPPKYASADFLKASYWKARGKLDVPKERFISYQKLSLDGDLLGWAGWDHLQQAQALSAVYLDRKKNAAWPAEQLLPILAGLAELEPWLHQWYTEPGSGFVSSPAAFFTGLVDTELSALGADRETLRVLRGVEELA